MDITTTQGMKQALTDKLRLGFGVTPEEADDAQVMRAAALVLRDVMTERGVESRMATRREEKRKVHYLSMEFLLGRSLEKNAYNLGVSGVLREAIGQVEAGAHILDVNAGVPGLDEPDVLDATVQAIQGVTDVPLQIDTSDAEALARALRHYNGKALVNSVNGKDEVMDAVFPLVAKYGVKEIMDDSGSFTP